MHNGLKVVAGGYYGDGITRMLKRNKGCHEPQEEVIFQELLRILPEKAIMIKGGAYWAFYSMWFMREVPHGKAYLIEPEAANVDVGLRNLAENGLHAEITNAYVAKSPGYSPNGIPVTAVDSFVVGLGLSHIDVLHMDIQGAEYDMLEGAQQMLARQAIDYIFISTHSEQLHQSCSDYLKQYAYLILSSVPPHNSFSYDGLIVAQSPKAKRLEFAPVSLKKSV